MERCPDAFDIIPPPCIDMTGEKKIRTSVYGRCQIGKTENTLVLAWLHWHFCSCFSFIAAWKFTSSVDSFLKSMDSFNSMIHEELDIADCLQLFGDAKLHAAEKIGRQYKFNDSDDKLQVAQVLVALSKNMNIDRIKEDIQNLVRLPILEDRMALLGKYPLVLLMDEDDQNTQSAQRDKYKTEISLYGDKQLSNQMIH